MKDKTIDYVLRTTWLAVNKMYNEEASKFDTTMATGFALLSIDERQFSHKQKLFESFCDLKLELSNLQNAC